MDSIKVIYQIITEVWGIIKKYHGKEFTDETWEEVIKELTVFAEGYQENSEELKLLARDLAFCTLNYFERISKKK